MQSQIFSAAPFTRTSNLAISGARIAATREATLVEVVALGRPRVVTEGTAIHRAGDPFRSVFFLNSGAAKRLLIKEDGREQILGFPMPGDILGMEAIDGGAHSTQ